MAAAATVVRSWPETEMWSRLLLRWEAAGAQAEMVRVAMVVVVPAAVVWVIFPEGIWVQARHRAGPARSRPGPWSRWSP
jgi:hypothetical protein